MLKPGQTVHGFLVSRVLPLTELQSIYFELVHEKSGAEVIQIANDDPENLFSLSFQTLPTSSNGVAHILEHTVLCGSKKFPVKDPFFAMTRRSLNTFMNALTGQDFTCYPASSQVEKDFYNLLEVYLDAVFHPQLQLLSFKQEGHRLAFAELDNFKSPLTFQGIVYNEMKGALLGSEARLWAHLFKALMPDLVYAHNSGGDPKEIPSLTHEELLEFHRVFYHPSRCLFFFYGNLPLVKHLEFLTQHALRGVTKEPFLAPLPLQPRFSSPRCVEASYPIPSHEELKKRTIFAWGVLTTSLSHQEELLALSVLDSLLTDTDVSPLKLALLQSGLCGSVESAFDVEMSEVPWVLICKGCEEQDRDQIAALVQKTLEELCIKGFDPKTVEASLHQLEFERTEIVGGDSPFGLHLFFRTALAKQHGADPVHALLIHSLFAQLRKKLQDHTYLPSLLRRYFLENPHLVLLTLKPNPHLEKEEQEEEQNTLEQIRAKLSEQQLKLIMKQQKELLLYQEQQEHQSQDCLPKITLKDVPPHAKNYPLTEIGGVFHHACFTNQILYADLGFDLPDLPFEDLSMLALMTRFVTELGSGGRSYAETLELQQATVGELIASLSLHVQRGNPNRCKPSFSFRGKVLQRNVRSLFDLMRDSCHSVQFNDPARIRELLQQHVTLLQHHLPRAAMSYATQLALSNFSLPAAIQQEWNGLSYYQFVRSCMKKKPEELCVHLERIYRSFHSPSFFVLGCDQDQRRTTDPLLPTLSTPRTTEWSISHPLSPVQHQGRIIASPVAFSLLAFSVPCDSAPLLVATDLLEHLVLHREIRERGGAYGSGASYSPLTGHFYLHAYRDPHLARTYRSFIKAIETISAGVFSEEELEEAKLSTLQDLDGPLPPGQRATTAYHWLRSQRNYEYRDAFRQAVMETSKQEVATMLDRALSGQQGTFVSFSGKELLQQEAKQLPFPLIIEEI
jgi:presequence protease